MRSMYSDLSSSNCVAVTFRRIILLRREAVDLSLAAASRLIEKRLDGETDRKLVLEFLATLDEKR